MDHGAAYTILPDVHIADVSGGMPLYPHVQSIRHRGTPSSRSAERVVVSHKAHTALPSLGWKRI